MEAVLWWILIYVLFLAFIIYVFMCGNTAFHRDGIVGAMYRLFTVKIPETFFKVLKKIFPERLQNKGCLCCCRCCKCCSNFCGYFIVFFFYLIYMFFILVNFCNVYPKADKIFKNPSTYYFLSLFVLPFPWLLIIVLNIVDPGTITPTNVRSYLKIYPYDNVLYKPTFCRTTNLPVVPRSRYDRYTKKRIAYFFYSNKIVVFL